ncbi:hypothetical protein D3C85_1890220 [compost metagenome]
MQARFHRGMNAGLTAALQQFCRHGRLHEGFTAGKCQAATGAQIKRPIAQHLGHDIVDIYCAAAQAECVGWATGG